MMSHKMNRIWAAVTVGLCLLAATHGYAACAEGTEITGKNGHVYCKSNVSMNWYTAFAWCDTKDGLWRRWSKCVTLMKRKDGMGILGRANV